MINHDEIRNEWLLTPEVGQSVEFTIKQDGVKEMKEKNDNSGKYPVWVFTVKNATGESLKTSLFKKDYNDMVSKIAKLRGIEFDAVDSLIGTKWLKKCELEENEKVYSIEFVSDVK